MMKVLSTACAVALICLSPAEVQCSSAAAAAPADDVDSSGEASVPPGADDARDISRVGGTIDSPVPRDRLLQEQVEMQDNYNDLQRQFFEANGREFTEDELNEALAEAHERLPPRDDPSFPSNRWMYIRDLPDEERRKLQSQHDARRLERRLTIRKGTMFVVSAASPGFEWNLGRNLFWCAAVKEVDRTQVRTQRRQKLTLKNCYTTDEVELIINYNDAFEMVQDKLDRIFFDWCLEIDAIRIDQAVRLNHCNIYADTQLWTLEGETGTWRPELDNDLCVTCRYSQCSSRDPQERGSALRFMPCLPDVEGENPFRTGQVWRYCYLSNDCKISGKKLSCDINERCG